MKKPARGSIAPLIDPVAGATDDRWPSNRVRTVRSGAVLTRGPSLSCRLPAVSKADGESFADNDGRGVNDPLKGRGAVPRTGDGGRSRPHLSPEGMCVES
jgi:hypothetical protein